jgi:hypothetical protein
MTNNKQQTSKDSLQDILEAKIASLSKPKKVVGWYCLSTFTPKFIVAGI